MFRQKNINSFSDELHNISEFLDSVNISSDLISAMPRGDLLACLLSAIEYGLSSSSGLPISIKFKQDSIDIYVERMIEESPEGFDEVSLDMAQKHNLTISKDSNNNMVAFHYIKSIKMTEFNQFDRQMVLKISEKFENLIKGVERVKEYEQFKNRVGEVVSGTIMRIESGNFIVDVDEVECLLPKTEIIPGEYLAFGDKVTAYIREVMDNSKSNSQYQVILNRNSPEFVIKLFKYMIPEIESGSIVIKSCARRAGRGSKVSIHSIDPSIDPVGPCIGRGGSKITSIRSLLSNELIHVVRWSSDPVQYISSALHPIVIDKIVLMSDKYVKVVADETNIHKARTSSSWQIRLASILTGYKITAISESEDMERMQKERTVNLQSLIEAGVSEENISLLAKKGITDIRDILDTPPDELRDVLDGYDEIFEKATEIVKNDMIANYNECGVSEELANIPGVLIDPETFVEYDIKTREELASAPFEVIFDMIERQYYDYDLDNERIENIARSMIEWAQNGDHGA